jgi:hypothetical protein
VKLDAGFSERGSLDLLESILVQVCSALDTFSQTLTTACDDAMFRFVCLFIVLVVVVLIVVVDVCGCGDLI